MAASITTILPDITKKRAIFSNRGVKSKKDSTCVAGAAEYQVRFLKCSYAVITSIVVCEKLVASISNMTGVRDARPRQSEALHRRSSRVVSTILAQGAAQVVKGSRLRVKGCK
jgi:hypothetical protein